MNELTQQLCEMLENIEWKYTVQEHEDGRVSIHIGMSGDNFHGLDFVVIPDDEETAGLRCWGICTVPQDGFDRMIRTANDLNDEYRWVKFVLDDDGDFNVQQDVEGTPDTTAELTMQALHRMIEIVDRAYPAIMRARFA